MCVRAGGIECNCKLGPDASPATDQEPCDELDQARYWHEVREISLLQHNFQLGRQLTDLVCLRVPLMPDTSIEALGCDVSMVRLKRLAVIRVWRDWPNNTQHTRLKARGMKKKSLCNIKKGIGIFAHT